MTFTFRGFIPTFISLCVFACVSCNSLHGSIELRKTCKDSANADDAYLVNHSKTKRYRFTVKKEVISSDRQLSISFQYYLLEPGEEIALGCIEELIKERKSQGIRYRVDSVVVSENEVQIVTTDSNFLKEAFATQFFYKGEIFMWRDVLQVATEKRQQLADFVKERQMKFVIPKGALASGINVVGPKIGDSVQVLSTREEAFERVLRKNRFTVTGESHIKDAPQER